MSGRTPWEVEAITTPAGPWYTLRASNGATICGTGSRAVSERIAECVNNYQTLVEHAVTLTAQRDALRDALRYIIEWNDGEWNAETARDKARAALAIVDGAE